MTDQLKVGDVVMVECQCHSCARFGPPDPSEENGPYIVTQISQTGITAKVPFGRGQIKHWLRTDVKTFKVVGRALDEAGVYTATGAR